MTSKSIPSEHPAITSFKTKASHLKSLLKGRHPEVSHGESLDILSKIEGRKKGWNQMSAELKAQQEPPDVTARKQRSFIMDTLLPRYMNLVRSVGLSPSNTPWLSIKEDGVGILNSCTIALVDEPSAGCLTGDMEITPRGIQWRDWSLELAFPRSAFSFLTKLLVSEVLMEDQTPRVIRCFGSTPGEDC